MNRCQNSAARASALQLSVTVTLVCFLVTFFAVSFRAAPIVPPNGQQSSIEGAEFYPPLPNSFTNFLRSSRSPISPEQSVSVAVTAPSFTMDVSDGFAINNQTVSISQIGPEQHAGCFQADLIFDSAVAAPSPSNHPIDAAGLTSATGWTMGANTLNSGPGTLKTLRVSVFANDGVTTFDGSGPIFVIHWKRVSSVPGQSTALTWSAYPNDFEFIDTDLNAWSASPQNNGMITITGPGTAGISGNVNYCSNATAPAVPGVTMALTGSVTGSTSTDSAGNYAFASLSVGGSFIVTPGKAALAPASAGINVMDLLALHRHFLNLTVIPPGCRLTAADVNGDGNVNNIDITAVLRFYLGNTNGISNVGKYNFNPASRTYSSISGTQTGQNYDALVFGDVASGFVNRPQGQSHEADSADSPATAATVTIPAIRFDQSRSHFTADVTTSVIEHRNNLVGFQGDFIFDERVVSFEEEPVAKAGLTAGNWTVAGNVLPGRGPIRTLRVAAFSNDFAPLVGTGTLFDLKIKQTNRGAGNGEWLTAAPSSGFIFIDGDLRMARPNVGR